MGYEYYSLYRDTVKSASDRFPIGLQLMSNNSEIFMKQCWNVGTLCLLYWLIIQNVEPVYVFPL